LIAIGIVTKGPFLIGLLPQIPKQIKPTLFGIGTIKNPTFDDCQEYFRDYYILLLVINDYWQLLQKNPHPLWKGTKEKPRT